MALFFGKNARDSRQAPVLIRLFEMRSTNSSGFKTRAKFYKLLLVANSQMDNARMVVGRATVLIGVFNCGMCALNSLLRDWDVAARDGVQVKFEVLHFGLTCI